MGDWIERNRGFVLVVLINLTLIGGLSIWLKRPDPPTRLEIVPPEATVPPVPTLTSTPSPLRVYVTGAVISPDVYRMTPGSIVADAIQAAGGAAEDADLVRINLAVELQDQQQIYVPRKGETEVLPPIRGGEAVPSLGGSDQDGKININTATLDQLDTLPGIGPAIGQRILDYREVNGPFKSVEEITLVSGIGDATFEKIKDRITVGD